MLFFLIMTLSNEEREHIEEMYLEYKDILFRIAKSILKDEYLAEDAVNITFINMIPHLYKFPDVKCHSTKRYLIVVVRNTSYQIYRKRKKEKNISLEHVEYKLSDEIKLEDKIFSDLEDNDFLKAAESLKDEYRDILRLKYVLKLENDEIAKILNINEINVRKRLERARKGFMKVVAERRGNTSD